MKQILYWVTLYNRLLDDHQEFSKKRYVEKDTKKTDLIDWINQLKKDKNLQTYVIINCGVIED